MIQLADFKALKRLMVQGRATWAELAADLNMSAPAAAERVHKLEERHIIRGYAALVDPAAVDYPMTAFIAVTLDKPKHREGFLAAVTNLNAVVECHHITGDDDYLLKVRARGTTDLDRLITLGIKSVPGVARTRTTMVLSTLTESLETPIAIQE